MSLRSRHWESRVRPIALQQTSPPQHSDFPPPHQSAPPPARTSPSAAAPSSPAPASAPDSFQQHGRGSPHHRRRHARPAQLKIPAAPSPAILVRIVLDSVDPPPRSRQSCSPAPPDPASALRRIPSVPASCRSPPRRRTAPPCPGVRRPNGHRVRGVPGRRDPAHDVRPSCIPWLPADATTRTLRRRPARPPRTADRRERLPHRVAERHVQHLDVCTARRWRRPSRWPRSRRSRGPPRSAPAPAG